MFETKDFIEYFTEIEMLEKNMHDTYAEASRQITDPEIREIFETLSMAEKKHEELVDELRRLAIKKSLKSKSD